MYTAGVPMPHIDGCCFLFLYLSIFPPGGKDPSPLTAFSNLFMCTAVEELKACSGRGLQGGLSVHSVENFWGCANAPDPFGAGH